MPGSSVRNQRCIFFPASAGPIVKSIPDLHPLYVSLVPYPRPYSDRALRRESFGRGYGTLSVCIGVRASCHRLCPYPARYTCAWRQVTCAWGYRTPWVCTGAGELPPALGPVSPGARRTHKAWSERARGYGPLKQVVPPKCERGERLAFAKPRSPLRLPRSPGSVLLSRELPLPVSSALEGLTVVFGMGTRVSPPLWPPGFRVPVSPRALQPRLRRESRAWGYRTLMDTPMLASCHPVCLYPAHQTRAWRQVTRARRYRDTSYV